MVLERALKEVMVGESAAPASPTMMPGVALSSAPAARVAGSLSMTSLLITICRVAFWTSTTGVSPVTVIVSSSPPTRISIGMVSVCEPVNSILSRTTVLKPGSANVRA